MARTPRRAAGVPVAPKNTAPRNAKGRGWRRFFIWSGIGLLVVLLAAGTGLGVAYATVALPNPNADFQTNTSFVYFNDGKTQLGSYSIQNRVTLAYKDIPQNVKDAIVAGENRTFWEDPGISIPGMIRAAFSLVTKGEDYASGGSTLTQQYIKIMYLTQERSFTRKFTEILLAAKMGNEMSKEEILGGYLNTVYFGRGAYGIEAASQAYFGKASKKLSLAEAVALTAIVNNPGNLDPSRGDKQAADLLERYQYTLNGLVEMGKITEAQKNEIYWKLPKFPDLGKDSRLGGPKGFLLNMVENELKANGFTEEQISGGGLKITSSFDAKAQDAAVEAAQKLTLQTVRGNAKKARKLHAALASIDNATGEVIALYGGPDYVKSSFNWATTPRPVGSTFKPYALVAGLRNGVTLSDRFNGNSWTPPGNTTPVTNAGGSSYGSITLLNATTHSVNTAYVDMLFSIQDGGEEALTAAHDAGLPDAADWKPDARQAPLGRPQVSPLHQAAGFATFANNGKSITPHVVREVKDASGKVLYKAQVNPEQTIEEDVAIDVNYALTHVTSDGTGARASALGYPLAGKTGTYYVRDGAKSKTQACWFVGYTRQISTAVMYVAGDQGTDDLDKYYPGFFGSGPPLSTWLAYMKVAQAGLPQEGWDPPTKRVSTMTPTAQPTKPTKSATSSPTAAPSESATVQPTQEPTQSPTQQPSEPPASKQPKPSPSTSP